MPDHSRPPKDKIASVVDDYAAAQSQLPVEQRIAFAKAHGRRLADQGLSLSDYLLAGELLRVIVKDAEVRVREALAQTLSDNARAPHDVVVALASDIDLVALPVLQASTVLTEADLVALVETQKSFVKMNAMAKRKAVGENLAYSLSVHGNDDVVKTLLDNRAAAISEPAFHKIIDRFGEQEDVQKYMVGRIQLAPKVLERLVAYASMELIARIIERHGLPSDLAVSLATETRERATVGLASGLSPEVLGTLITDMIAAKRLTPELLLRSLHLGNFEFFAHGLAAMTLQAPAHVARRLTDFPEKDLSEFWLRAGLPDHMLPKAAAALAAIHQTQKNAGALDVKSYQAKLAERVAQNGNQHHVAADEEDYLLRRAQGEDVRLASHAKH